MSLLPRSPNHFQLKEYWDRFFTRRSSAFEWYGDYTNHCHILHKYIKPSNRILVVGCGNSKLSEGLYDAGFHAIDNVDISDVVIKKMAARNRQKRPEMTFSKMDLLHIGYEDRSYDCVIDKGTLDAIFSHAEVSNVLRVRRIFQEIERVLKVAGRYLCVTLAQDHVKQMLLGCFESGWLVRVHQISLEGVSGLGGALPVFIFVLTKMAQIEGKPPVKLYEHVSEDGSCQRFESLEELSATIRASQEYAMLTHYLRNLHVDDPPMQVDLHSKDGGNEPKYSLFVIDIPKRKTKKGPFAIFIAPQGREMDWLFSTEQGRKQVAESASFERLILVTLHRGHAYTSVEDVREEVEGDLVKLMQGGLPQGKYPVLTIGDGLGTRTVLFKETSPVSGEFVVEESDMEGGVGVRRLVFLSSPHLSQTEVKTILVRHKKKSRKKHELDLTHLASGHHRGIIAALALVNGIADPPAPANHVNSEDQVNSAVPVASGGLVNSVGSAVSESSPKDDELVTSDVADSTEIKEEEDSGDKVEATVNGTSGSPALSKRILIIGLGGGALPTYIQRYIPTTSVDVVELDGTMVEVAEKWFGFCPGERLCVHIADGLEFVKEMSAVKKDFYHAIILDVDSKDGNSGMSSPPMSFLGQEFLATIKMLLHEDGALIINLTCRNPNLRSQALSMIWINFPTLILLPIPEDVNEIIVALPRKRDDIVSAGKGNLPTQKQVPPPRHVNSSQKHSGSATPKREALLSDKLRASVSGLAAMISSSSSGALEAESLEDAILTLLRGSIVGESHR